MNKVSKRHIKLIMTLAMLVIACAAMAQRTDTPSSVTVGGNVFGGGNEAMVGGNCTVIINQDHATITHDVYGGGALAKVNTIDGTTLTTGKSTNVTLMRGIVEGDLYGGGLGDNTSGSEVAADVLGPVTVTIEGGTVAGSVFGCNNLYGAPQSTVTVNVVNDLSGVTMTLHNVYGGGNLAAYSNNGNNYPEVNIKHGTVDGSVFGGGLGATAVVTGNPQVTIGDDVAEHTAIVNNNVYGGGDLAVVTGSTTVTVQNAHSQVGIDVYGGGNQADVLHSTTVHINNGTIGQDVYGGGAFADVGTSNSDQTTVNILGGTVTRDIYGGGLGQTAVDDNPETPDDDESLPDIVALVNGVVHVNIGTVDNTDPENPAYSGAATIGGCVFGCNNINGTPKNNVFVDVYGTAHTSANTYPNPEPTLDQLLIPAADNAYAIKAVYGGGNKAAYAPVDNDKTAQVHVYSCVNTIQTVYGGGNAANATKVHTIIDGGRFDRVFGGGNGYSETGNHDYPGLPNYNPGANVTVSATTEIHGGLFRQVFGGSNQYGDVANASLAIDSQSGCSELIGEAFGGANEANITGNVTTTLGCSNVRYGNFYGGSNLADITGNVTLNVNGGYYTSVFGGSKGRLDDNTVSPAISAKAANITGDVTLNLYGGIMTNAFGGSDVNGNIGGKITVNLDDAENPTCPLVVHNIYGGGRDASYTPNTPGAYPVVNLIKGTVSTYVENEVTKGGLVFGGGLGETAEVTSNPKVNLQGGVVQTAIFGGGEAAPVTGNPVINANYGTAPTIHGGGWGSTAIVTGNPSVVVNETNGKTLTVTSVYGGGDAALVTGNTIVDLIVGTLANAFGGGNQAGVSGTASVNLAGASVTSGLYGGCNTSGIVTGNATVNVTGGTVGTPAEGTLGEEDYVAPVPANIYGGGLGANTRMSGDVAVNIGATDGEATPTYSGTAIIYGDVYGGSAKGKTNCNADGDAQNGSAKTDVNLYSGTVYGDLYGGGHGLDGASADVWGPVTVTVYGVSVIRYNVSSTETKGGRVFGCNNLNGTPKTSTLVDIKGGVVDYSVFGGGNLANATIDTHVIVEGGTVNDVYGGGAYASTGATIVDILDGIVEGNVYGGCLGGEKNETTYVPAVNGDATVNIGSGTVATSGEYEGFTTTPNNGNATFIGGSIYGGNDAKGSPTGIATVNIYKTAHTDGTGNNTVTGDYYAIMGVYGGGNEAEFIGTESHVNVYGCDNTIDRVFGGGDEASSNTVYTMIQGGRINQVYGGGNGYLSEIEVSDIAANIYGSVNLSIHGGNINQVFGAGNEKGTISGAINLTIDGNGPCGGLDVTELFCGSNLADIGTAQNPVYLNSTIGCNATFGDIYGGCNLADITGDVSLTIKGSTIANVYAGSKGQAAVTADPDNGIDEVEAKAANISGSVTLNLYGGSVGNAFGGSNINGNVGGKITVNMDWSSNTCETPSLTNLYGASNLATYTPTTPGAYPEVNIIHGTVSGSVYGGGKGDVNDATKGVVTSNPKVTIGDNNDSHLVIVTGNVYGGGDAAAVTGSTTVEYKDNNANSTVGKLFGGGNAAGVSSTASVTLTSGTVTQGLYGGCNSSGTVGGNITVALNGGTVGVDGTTTDVVYGGGFGHSTNTTGNIGLTLNGTTVYGNLYGGSALQRSPSVPTASVACSLAVAWVRTVAMRLGPQPMATLLSTTMWPIPTSLASTAVPKSTARWQATSR